MQAQFKARASALVGISWVGAGSLGCVTILIAALISFKSASDATATASQWEYPRIAHGPLRTLCTYCNVRNGLGIVAVDWDPNRRAAA